MNNEDGVSGYPTIKKDEVINLLTAHISEKFFIELKHILEMVKT